MKKTIAFIIPILLIFGCTETGPSGPEADNFDREEMLENWADNLIIPAFTNFSETTGQLHDDAVTFSENPSAGTLADLRESWEDAYLAFQHVAMFEKGKPMELRFRDNLNIYPIDTDEIENSIQSGEYNLELPSLTDSQGFPALDYLLNGLGESDDSILEHYKTHENSDGYREYITDLTRRIDNLTTEVLDDWTGGYRDEFVSNSGDGANSSLDMMVNDYIFYYEKHLRTGKIGIPAGVFSGSPISSKVETYYSRGLSKELFFEGMQASVNFFNGFHFENGSEGLSLNDYLEYLNTTRDGDDLASVINNQFEVASTQAEELHDDFAHQVETDNSLMLSTFDALQPNVVFLKVDMLQALNIKVDYVDADGD